MQATHTNVKGARHCGMQGDAWPLRAPQRAGCRLPFSVVKYEPPRGALLGTRPAGDGPIFVVTLAARLDACDRLFVQQPERGAAPQHPARERPLRRFTPRVRLPRCRLVRMRPAGPPGRSAAAAAFFDCGSNRASHRAHCDGSTPSGAGKRRPRREPPPLRN